MTAGSGGRRRADAGTRGTAGTQPSGAAEPAVVRDFPDGPVDGAGLTQRQRRAITHLKVHRRITNASYQTLLGVSRRTALRELADLVTRGLILPAGRGRSAHYVLKTKRATNAPNAPSSSTGSAVANRAKNEPNAPRAGRKPRSGRKPRK